MTAKLWGPPWNLHLIVLDLETCVAPDKNHRIVQIGIALCRGGGIRKSEAMLVSPGCPVDLYTSTKVHMLEDDDLVLEPTLDLVLPDIARYFTARNNERLVLAVHNANFDVHWLKTEIARVGGAPLPDIEVLDTAGPLAPAYSNALAGGRLEDLLNDLGILNQRPHDALHDATATAEAAIELLGRAEAAGETDVDALLAKFGSGTLYTATTPPPAVRLPAKPARPAVPVPPTHAASHRVTLGTSPTPFELQTWLDLILECARIRCDRLFERGLSVASVDLHRNALLDALPMAAASGDRPATATILGALAPYLANPPTKVAEVRGPGRVIPAFPGPQGQRSVAMGLAVWLEPLVGSMSHCPRTCPACRVGRPCPIDAWPTYLAAAAQAMTKNAAEFFWDPTAAPAGSNNRWRGYVTARARSLRLADAMARIAYKWFDQELSHDAAIRMAEQVWAAGSRDPFLTEMLALEEAKGGRSANLAAAYKRSAKVLRKRLWTRDAAWVNLQVRSRQFEARLARMSTPARKRHHASNPVRPPHPMRFVRVM